MNVCGSKVIETARELLKAYGYFIDKLWHVDDVHFLCEQKGLPTLSNQEAMEVFGIVVEQFDGEVGLCWPQLEKAVCSYFKRRKMLCNLFIEYYV